MTNAKKKMLQIYATNVLLSEGAYIGVCLYTAG